MIPLNPSLISQTFKTTYKHYILYNLTKFKPQKKKKNQKKMTVFLSLFGLIIIDDFLPKNH